MFTNMPNLKELDLNNNQFVTLDEDTFRWPFENLASLMFKGNAFRCDCRLRWLVGTKKPSTFEAICNLPDSLNGVSVENLVSSSLWCI
ncbi:uncharacterized protein TNCT_369791 [Trichonephila clavata]|uniref:Uncharacterized protein n=1 Tax=Trichonephila clavata TaxID=2740835 RepID=A0A8X6JIE1_TRICU|nr:uncharacterized protein TNCT_369791 [Trichonephila clavata]